MSPGVIRPLPRPVPLRQSVYDALIDLIVGGELPPGQHMVETGLARHLGVSRQPIREALHRMEAEGWVDLRPSQGAFVHVPIDSEVDELLDVRALLEAETAGLAARAAGPAQVATLRKICAGGRAAAGQGDVGAAVAANDSFHAEIAAIAGNSVLAELADIVGRRVQWYYRMVAPARGHDSWAEHSDMIDAIEAADPEQAKLLARRHTERTRDAYHSSLFTQALDIPGGTPVPGGKSRTFRSASRTTLSGPGAHGSFALSMSPISPRRQSRRRVECIPAFSANETYGHDLP